MPGPIIVCDKSFIEMLSLDESVWLDHFFSNNIIPPLYIETLGNLEKERKGRSREDLVKEIAHKIPQRNVFPNIYHKELIYIDLYFHLGLCPQQILMDQKPIVRAELIKNTEINKTSIHFQSFAEIDALQRWQESEFNEIERIISKEGILDFENEIDKWVLLTSNILSSQNPKDFESAKKIADLFVNKREENHFLLMIEMLNIPSGPSKSLLNIYRKTGSPPLCKFAPYTAYIFKIKIFLCLSIQCKIPGIDKSYKKDILYLFYLPFCQIFVSNDKSHNKLIPLFIDKEKQAYVNGKDLKKSLSELNNHYLQNIDEINKQGVMNLSSFPPELSNNNEVIKLWDRFCPNWRQLKKQEREIINTKISSNIRKIKTAPVSINPFDQNKDFDSVLIERKISKSRARFKIFF